MSDSPNNPEALCDRVARSPLAIYICVETPALAHSLKDLLKGDRYNLTQLSSSRPFNEEIELFKDRIDCLILERCPPWLGAVEDLYAQGILLPVVLLDPDPLGCKRYTYHTAEVCHSASALASLPKAIERAIAQFLTLAPLHDALPSPPSPTRTANVSHSLLVQQRRLSQKLEERLGYLGVYYKRNPQDFWPNLSRAQQQEVVKLMRVQYREILLAYFSDTPELNPTIDRFVTQAFFVDLSISQVLEIHMELIDEFSQQLKIEGRSEEILLDYRLALIDVIAHLCEMYRRSIPREDLLLEWYARD